MVIFLLLIIACFLGGCSSKPNGMIQNEDIKEILINPDKVEAYLDLSEIVDSMEIISLETTEKCLISEIDRIEINQDLIYVSDRTNAKIFVFTAQGKFLKSIGRQGMGPGEYSHLGNFTFKDDSIIVQDRFRSKYVTYDLSGNLSKEIPYDVFHLEIVPFNNLAYFISSYIQSEYGNFNLYKFDFRIGKIVSSMIPFDNESIDKSTYGLRRYTSKCGNEATLIYPLNDTIYTLRENVVAPSYVVHFTSKNLPKELTVDKNMLFRYIRKNGYLKGLEYLQNSQDYLLGYYIDKINFKYFIYNKCDTSIDIGNRLKIGLLGGMIFHDFYTSTNNRLYIYQDAATFSFNWKSMRDNCKNIYYREKVDFLVKELNDDSNPILLKCNFKKVNK